MRRAHVITFATTVLGIGGGGGVAAIIGLATDSDRTHHLFWVGFFVAMGVVTLISAVIALAAAVGDKDEANKLEKKHKMIPLIGMIVCAIGLIVFGVWFFWSHTSNAPTPPAPGVNIPPASPKPKPPSPSPAPASQLPSAPNRPRKRPAPKPAPIDPAPAATPAAKPPNSHTDLIARLKNEGKALIDFQAKIDKELAEDRAQVEQDAEVQAKLNPGYNGPVRSRSFAFTIAVENNQEYLDRYRHDELLLREKAENILQLLDHEQPPSCQEVMLFDKNPGGNFVSGAFPMAERGSCLVELAVKLENLDRSD